MRLIRTDVGIDVLCSSEDTEALAAVLAAAGAEPIDEQTAEIVRIESGRPRFGVEVDETTMPQEAGIHERAVSYSKGCYIGQETVARLYWKGKPNRHLRGLRFEQPPERGAPADARRPRGGRGRIGRALAAPRHDRPGAGAPRGRARRDARGLAAAARRP